MATPHAISNTKHGRYKSAIRIIGLMGRCQAGKSVFINDLTQQWDLQPEAGKFLENGSRTTVVEKSGLPYMRTLVQGYHLVEMPGFQNQPPDDGDGAIIQEIARFLVQVYEDQGFAGLVYLHDFSQSTPSTAIRRDIALLSAMIGPELYDHTALVLNKYRDEISVQCPGRRTEVESSWRHLTAFNRAVIRENRPLRGEPRPTVELIWEKPPKAFALTKELAKGTKLRKTTVGRVYKMLLEREIAELERGSARRAALKEELKKWKNCPDDYESIVAELERRDSSIQ